MRAISLFSGVGGFERGLERAGIQTILQVENDPWCLSVLARHWPECERITDVRQVDAATLQGRRRDMVSVGVGSDAEWLGGTARGLASIDLCYGGFPCQDLSVAGKRAGLRGERSGLWHEFQRVLSELRPRWCLIENVPGLLSSNGGADFGVLLRGLDDLGYGLAWRVLDARWFGVPQRRRRVFLVGCLGDARRAAQVLAVCESCGGHSQARGEEGQDVAYALNASVRGTGDLNSPQAWNTDLVADPVTSSYAKQADSTDRAAGPVNLLVQDIAPMLDDGARRASVELPMIVGSTSDGDSARSRDQRASGYRMDMESETFVVASPDRASDGHHGHSSGRGDGADNLITVIGQNGSDIQVGTELGALTSGMARQTSGDLIADPISAHEGKTWTHEGSHNFRTHNLIGGVRRLTPLECERLQGWPDDHTRWTADGREIPDSHRYRMIGNGVVAPCSEWIGHRLMSFEGGI